MIITFTWILFLLDNSKKEISLFAMIFISCCFGAKSIFELYKDKDIDFFPGIGLVLLLLSLVFISAKLGIKSSYLLLSSLLFLILVKSEHKIPKSTLILIVMGIISTIFLILRFTLLNDHSYSLNSFIGAIFLTSPIIILKIWRTKREVLFTISCFIGAMGVYFLL